MAGKFYAVRAGRKTGIFLSWNDCKAQIDGYSGAVYKSFKTKAEAEDFLQNENVVRSTTTPPDETEVSAYVDGSYDKNSKAYSYGVVLFHQGQKLLFKEKFTDQQLADMRNVAGEIKGAQRAMQYGLDENVKSMTIYHDYEGIAHWCTGAWQAKKEGTMAYRDFYREAAKQMDIKFVKVKGHSGDKYNELADQLAKSALKDGFQNE